MHAGIKGHVTLYSIVMHMEPFTWNTKGISLSQPCASKYNDTAFHNPSPTQLFKANDFALISIFFIIL